METVEVVKTTLNKLLGIKMEEMKPETNLSDNLGMDSTELVEVAIALEKALGVKIPKGTLNIKSTISQVASALDKIKQS
jgi:acyl carrier protein